MLQKKVSAALAIEPAAFARTSHQLQCRRWHRTGIVSTTARAYHPRRQLFKDYSSISPFSRSNARPPLPRVHLQSRTSSTTPEPQAAAIDPHREDYKPPSTGILSLLPRSWVPYAELIRIDKPAGTNYLFLPCIFSTLLAAPLAAPIAAPSTIAGTIALFYAGAIVMRGAGCTINDLWDRNLDSKVARTRLRPIARGAITVPQALPFLAAQLTAGLAILLQFPAECFFYAAPSLIFVALYPLAKRVTYYPQAMLGLTFSWGAFMGFPALGVDLLSDAAALTSAACMYASCVTWCLIYDMIYAYQDIRDDAKAGIKSMALAHDGNAKALLSAFAVVQVSLLAGAGVAAGAGPIFFVGVCGGAASTLAYMIRVVNLNDVKDCWAWFKRGAWLTGGAISIGLAAEYAAQYSGWYGSDEQARKQITK